MPIIDLTPVQAADADDLFKFEIDNRAYFESVINARPANYYSPDGVQAAIDLALREAGDDKGYQYLIRNEQGALVGRVNLANVRRTHYHSAEIGYRIAESEGGKGYAGEAVRQVLTKAFIEHGLMRIEAKARLENVGSTRVLVRNGFTQFGHAHRSFQLGDVWYDVLHFEKRADA